VATSSQSVAANTETIAYVSPIADTTYELRQTTVNTITITNVGQSSSMEITQINNIPVAVQATATGTLTTNMVKYTRTSAQTSNIAENNVIICNTSETSLGSGISVNTTTGQITLTAGKTYRLRGSIPTFVASNGLLQYCWYNETTSAWIGESAAQYPPSNNAAYGAMGGTAEVVLTVGSTTVVSFRVLRNTGVTSLGGNTDFSTIGSYPWIDAQEITTSFSLNTLSTMSTTDNVSVGGGLTVGTIAASGNEGGQIDLATAPSGTLSTGTVSIDIYQDRLRIFENNGSFRGAYLDISKLPGSVGGELQTKVSGYVNAGVFLTMDNLKATVTTSSNYGLSLATVSGSFAATIAATYSLYGSNTGGTANALTITTTASSSVLGFNFVGQGDTSTYIINDTTNSRVYRITLMIGGSYINNFISIERLV
jgi:hypothetical protein